MRRIIRRREVVLDALRYPGEPAPEGAAPEGASRDGGPQAVTLAELTAAAAAAAAGTVPRHPDAVVLAPDDEVALLEPWIPALRVIVIEFPKHGEGRGYSQARILRTRLRYDGELRARGAIGRDQLYFLARCGFDSFELAPAEDPEAALAAFTSFSVATQDGSTRVVAPRLRGSG